MSKLQDYDFHHLPQSVVGFKDDVRDLINNGKYQVSISSGTPTYLAGSGEFALYLGAVGLANASAFYLRTGSNFSLVAQFTNLG